MRARLGSVSADVFEPNQRSLEVAFENVSAAASRIRDVDFAEEIATSLRLRLLRESGLSVLRQVNSNAGLALKLLA